MLIYTLEALPSLCISRMGYVPHFKLSALSTSLHITQHLKIPAIGIGHLFHESLGLIPKTLLNSSLSMLWPMIRYSCAYFFNFYCSINKATMKQWWERTDFPTFSFWASFQYCLPLMKIKKEQDLNKKKGNNLWHSETPCIWVCGCTGVILYGLFKLSHSALPSEQYNPHFSSKVFGSDLRVKEWLCRWQWVSDSWVGLVRLLQTVRAVSLKITWFR